MMTKIFATVEALIMQTPKHTPYDYAPRPGSNGTMRGLRKLTTEDREHIKKWRAMGFSVEAIAKEYDLTIGYVYQIVRGQK